MVGRRTSCLGDGHLARLRSVDARSRHLAENVRGVEDPKGARMSKSKAGQVRIGTSGYQYRHWKGIFYPDTIRQRDWFAHYAGFFDTVELNNTFYRLPGPQTFQNWRDRTPEGFCWVLKYSRFGSHIMHLKDPARHLGPFLANAELLQPFLGPILVQLPPSWHVDLARLDEFLAAAPRQHRWALEFRHPSWLCAEVYAVLRRYGAALCIHDKLPDHPHEITTAWTYLRYHGGPQEGNYPDTYLREQATRIIGLRRRGLDVYAFFNNDQHGYALINAADLRTLVTGQPNRLRELQWFW